VVGAYVPSLVPAAALHPKPKTVFSNWEPTSFTRLGQTKISPLEAWHDRNELTGEWAVFYSRDFECQR
jgi:hypothetical protein